MKRSAYLKRVQELYDGGKVRGEVYDAMLMHVDVFCNGGDEPERAVCWMYMRKWDVAILITINGEPNEMRLMNPFVLYNTAENR